MGVRVPPRPLVFKKFPPLLSLRKCRMLPAWTAKSPPTKASPMSRTTAVAVALVAVTAVCGFANKDGHTQEESAWAPERLAVVWSSGDPDVAHRVALMYTHAAKRAGWFDEVELIVWGPSARLLAGDKDLQAKIAKMQSDGVVVEACVVCADSYGVSDQLRERGVTVKPMGSPLSQFLKDGWKVITF